MKLLNATRMQANYAMGMEPSGRELLVVVVKGTFQLPRPDEQVALAAEQAPLVDSDLFTGEPGFSAPLYESDYAPFKPRCDVLLNGSAYAPGGRQARPSGSWSLPRMPRQRRVRRHDLRPTASRHDPLSRPCRGA